MNSKIKQMVGTWIVLGSLASQGLAQRASDTWNVESELAQQLTKINKRLTDAYTNENVRSLRMMLDDAHIHNNVFGVILTKEQFLKDIESGILEFESYETTKIQWHIDKATAIATGTIRARAKRNGREVPASDFLFTRVYVKRGDAWKVLLFHNTMMPKPGTMPEPSTMPEPATKSTR